MKQQNLSRTELNNLGQIVLESSVEVHRQLGPGLLESVYEYCLFDELTSKGLSCVRQVHLPVVYKNKEMPLNFRLDILIEDEVIVEIKAVEEILPVHEAQLITYLRLANKRLGYLINFNVRYLRKVSEEG